MAAGRAGPVALGIFRSQLLREGGKYLGTRLGGGGGGAPGGSSPYSFLEHGVGGGDKMRACVSHASTPCLQRILRHTCIHLCSPGPTLPPRLQLPGAWPSLDTIS